MKIIDSITVSDDVTLISISNSSADIEHIAKVFNMFSDAGINVDMISQLPPSGANSGFSFTVSDNDFISVLDICAELRKQNGDIKISVSNGNSKISVSGEAMRDLSGVAAKIFTAAAKNKREPFFHPTKYVFSPDESRSRTLLHPHSHIGNTVFAF